MKLTRRKLQRRFDIHRKPGGAVEIGKANLTHQR
jgi:hypothetical protein